MYGIDYIYKKLGNDGIDLEGVLGGILDEDEKGTHNMRTLGGEQKLNIINESGLYSAILKSHKPEAKIFKKWVTSEVLPEIRKTGGYRVPTIQKWMVEIEGDPWFVGKDVADVLGYSNPRDALRTHYKAKAAVTIHDGSQNRNVTIIPERDDNIVMPIYILSTSLHTISNCKMIPDQRWLGIFLLCRVLTRHLILAIMVSSSTQKEQMTCPSNVR